MTTKQDPYASEAETQALLAPDTRTAAERKLAQMMTERGADEQGAEAYLILWKIAVELLAEQPAPVQQEPEIDGATMAGMDASIGHLSALVDELRLLLGCAMDNFKMLHNAAKPDDGPDMDAIIPAIVFAKFVNQDAALRYAIKHSAHDGMITAPPSQPAPVQQLPADDTEGGAA